MAEDLSVVILADGTGSRMRTAQTQVLDRAGGRTMLGHVIAAARALDPTQLLVVVDPSDAALRDATELGGIERITPSQAGERVRSRTVLFIRANLPLVTAADLVDLLFQHRKTQADLTLFDAEADDETGAGICCVESRPVLWEAYDSLEAAGVGGLVIAHRAAKRRVEAIPAREPQTLLAVRSPVDLAQADRILRLRKADALLNAGVRIRDPQRADIDPDVTVGLGTEILPGTHLVGATAIGEGCVIGPDTWIEASAVEGGCTIRYSVVERARVREGCTVGPYAHLRPGADVGPRVRIGNFVEVKASRVKEGAKVGHLSYLGDTEVGSSANVGAGTITCNYDGRRKHRTTIGDGVFIGSNASLVAPVTIGDGAIVGAGSTITEDVPPGTLAIGRGRQVNKAQRKETKEEAEDARAGT